MQRFPRSRAFALFTACLLALPQLARSEATININGTDIWIGMDRDSFASRFSRYRIACIDTKVATLPECASVVVTSPEKPYQLFANVYFSDGKIKIVNKYWERGFEGSAPEAFVRTLFSVLASNQKEKAPPYTVEIAERRDPGSLQQTIFLTSGRKTIHISYVEGLRNPDGSTMPTFVNLTEVLE